MFNPSVTNCNSKHDLAGEIIFYVIYSQFWEIINFFWMILGNFEKIEIGFFYNCKRTRYYFQRKRQNMTLVQRYSANTHTCTPSDEFSILLETYGHLFHIIFLPSRWCVNIIHNFMFCIVVIAIGSELYIPYVNLFSFVCATVPIMRNSISDIISTKLTNFQDKTRALDYLLNLVSKYAF